ncbi:MAG: hypothetical protein K6A94_04745 [Bacteroidales bacterium]|jgi:hypothetical protein|nr:hypothetical protein [Bacteroidales bacterium]
MTKATIQSVRQTENAGLFTICFEGESYTEFQKKLDELLKLSEQKGTIHIEETNIEGIDDTNFEL